jgi:hypothetical protein
MIGTIAIAAVVSLTINVLTVVVLWKVALPKLKGKIRETAVDQMASTMDMGDMMGQMMGGMGGTNPGTGDSSEEDE